MRRFPSILFRSLAFELLKLLASATAAIVCVLAFGAAIKPLADGEIGPDDTVRIMAFAIIPMLQFALPFSSAFAATLTYHRFSSENEADAAMVSGIPHRTLLAPAIVVGIVLGLGISALMTSVIPNFLREMESIITRNVSEILIARVERGECIVVGNFQIYAESAQSVGPDPILPDGSGTGAFERLVLSGVLAVQSSDNANAQTAINAEQVFMWFFDDSDETGNAIAVQLVFDKAASFDSSTRMTTIVERLNSQRIRIPGQFRNKPKFLTGAELRVIKREPERMNYIETTRRVLAMRIAQHRTIDELDAQLRTSGAVEFGQGAGRVVRVASRGIEQTDGGWRLLPVRAGRGVRFSVSLEDGSERLYTAISAELVLVSDEGRWKGGDWTNTYTIEARNLTLDSDSSDADAIANTLGDYAFARLTPKEPPEDELLAMSSAALLTMAAQGEDNLGGAVQREAKLLQKRLKYLRNKILSKQHERYAYAVSSMIMVISGAVVGFKMRDSLPLVVYLWSFFPAMITFLSISTGRQFVEDSGAAALPLLWAGTVFIAAFTAYEFVRLRRH
ncbi:LptF/LptG family permease [Planctomycetaceae bacterium AH-315-I19]|nr:LptF/LptG family permease [Planctomycetaceae bacterium AH-315-I19]